jgi:hypothetical protein
MPRDLDLDAEATYEAAVERFEALCAAWDGLGRPCTASGSTGQLVAHPLLRAIADAGVVAERHRDELRMTRRAAMYAKPLHSA